MVPGVVLLWLVTLKFYSFAVRLNANAFGGLDLNAVSPLVEGGFVLSPPAIGALAASQPAVEFPVIDKVMGALVCVVR